MKTIDKLIEGKINIDQAINESKVREFDDIDPSEVRDLRALGSVRFYNQGELEDFVKSMSNSGHSNFHGHYEGQGDKIPGTGKLLGNYMHIGPMNPNPKTPGLIVPIDFTHLDSDSEDFDPEDFGPEGALVHFHHAYPVGQGKR